MRAYDIIEKKRDNKELSKEEIKCLINGYLDGEIADYQMSAFLMAVYFNGMTDSECAAFTECMLRSGDIMDLSSIKGVKVDKHSTGGVGDKTTLIVTPIVASCGVKVAKMSGRGLGYTGGTVDKLESIPNMRVALSKDKFFDIVENVGCCVVSQTGNLVPADKKIYALRDVTATVESIPLIASSIMSKKIASGADCILLDVKVGNGAFMKNKKDAVALSKIMVNIGKSFDKKVVAVITDMNSPLGNAIGNSLEVWESCEVLKGRGPEDLKTVSVYLASNMLYLAGKGSMEECEQLVLNSIKTGAAFEKFKEMIYAQGGNISTLEGDDYINKAKVKFEVLAQRNGYVASMNAAQLGKAAMILGAGREKKEDTIDYSAGIVLNKKQGDKVCAGEILATLYSSDFDKCRRAEEILQDALTFDDKEPMEAPLIHSKVTVDGVESFC